MADVSDPNSLVCLTIAATYARQERTKQFEHLFTLLKDTNVSGREPTYRSELLSLLGALPMKERRRLFEARTCAWLFVEDYLSFNFFTDDPMRLKLRKVRSSRLIEGGLADALTTLRLFA